MIPQLIFKAIILFIAIMSTGILIENYYYKRSKSSYQSTFRASFFWALFWFLTQIT